MTEKERNLAALLLESASEVFSNHGCNDMPRNSYDGWTFEEKKQLVKEFHDWNGDPEEFDDSDPNLSIPDYAIMDFLAHKLKQS